MSGLPPFSNMPPGGGHFTSSATPRLPTSARKERPPSCSKPKADTNDPRTLAIYTKPGTKAIAQLTATFDKERSLR